MDALKPKEGEFKRLRETKSQEMRDLWSTPFPLMHVMIMIITVITMKTRLSHSYLMMLNPEIHGKETETEILDNETNLVLAVEAVVKASQYLSLKWQLQDLTEMARDVLTRWR